MMTGALGEDWWTAYEVADFLGVQVTTWRSSGEPPQSTATGCTHRRNCAVEAQDNHSLGSEQAKEGRALSGEGN
jgi:hypothetical protein